MPLGDESSFITCSPKITGKGFAICKLLMKFRVMKYQSQRCSLLEIL